MAEPGPSCGAAMCNNTRSSSIHSAGYRLRFMCTCRKKGKKEKEYRIDDGAIGNDHRQSVAAQQHQKDLFSLFPFLLLKEERKAGTNRYRLTSFLFLKKK